MRLLLDLLPHTLALPHPSITFGGEKVWVQRWASMKCVNYVNAIPFLREPLMDSQMHKSTQMESYWSPARGFPNFEVKVALGGWVSRGGADWE